jgi:hypothetical protein
MSKRKAKLKKGKLTMAKSQSVPPDPRSVDVLRKRGFTHYVERDTPDGLGKEFHKAVRQHESGEGFVDENGFEYRDAVALPK